MIDSDKHNTNDQSRDQSTPGGRGMSCQSQPYSDRGSERSPHGGALQLGDYSASKITIVHGM
jgi:hypothetical protein